MKQLYKLAILATLLITASCSSSDKGGGGGGEDLPAEALNLSTNLIEYEYQGSQEIVNVTSGSKWKAYVYVEDPMLDHEPTWITIAPGSGTDNKEYSVKIVTTANPAPGERIGKVAFINSALDEPKIVTVKQAGRPTSEATAYLTTEKIVGNTYPKDVSGSKTTVSSDTYGLWFYGWNISDDKRFQMSFPDDVSSYNRVIMTYTMGCGPQGGSGYDHNTNIAFQYDGQWFEIASCITPFGNNFDKSFKKEYYFDVTEYLPMLTGNVDFKIYFGGFDASESGRHHTAKLTFDFYKGERNRNQVFVQRIYDSEETGNSGYRSWLYGRIGKSIEEEDRLSPRTINVPSNVKTLEMKVTISGHGADQGKFLDRSGYQTKNAAEFDYNYYTVKVNNVPCEQKGYIFISCANNYAQAGTCYYDRANWCPGNPVRLERWRFLNINPGESFDLDFDLERFQSEYTSSADGQAMYRVHVDLFGFDK